MSSKQIPEPSDIDFERTNVIQVYEQIADHFDTTRYKPWPVVETFLTSLAPQSLGLDIGCGNGKYFKVAPAVQIIGCDTCEKLLKIAGEKSDFVFLANALIVPVRDGCVDFCISIAVIHHLSTDARRFECLREMMRVLRVGGRCLVFVWAWEQSNPKRKYQDQDAQVSWVHKQTQVTYFRYYHFFVRGELEELVMRLGTDKVRIVKSGYDRDNWYVEFERIL